MGDLQAEACAHFGAVPRRALKAGGQKVVHLVELGGRASVLKLVQVGRSEPTVLERAKREFDLLASLDHPNIVKVESELLLMGEPVEGAAWLEEYLDGDDFIDLLHTPWSWDEVLELGLAVSSGLGALHDRGVVHRDLSGANVRKISSGGFKILDPGFARHTLRSGITVGGQPGTPGYMTPEHLQAYSGPTPASDVYAVGTLMYAAATRNLPIPWLGDEADYVARLHAATFAPLEALRPDCPPPLLAVIRRALHPQPARRYRNGSRLHEALEALR